MCLPALIIPAAAAIGSAVSSLGAALPATLALVGTGLAAAQGFTQYQSQKQAANAQVALANAVAANAAGSYRTQTAYLDDRLLQTRDAAVQQDTANAIQGEQAKARARTAAAESGAAGVSLDNILGDLTAQQARNSQAIAYNYDVARQDTQTSKVNAYYQMQDRIDSIPLPAYPSLLTPILGTAGAALSNFSTYGLTRGPTSVKA
jgi:hypothetical protein